MAGAAYQGIEFASVPLALEMAGVKKKKDRAAVLRGLKVMQRAARPVLNGVEIE